MGPQFTIGGLESQATLILLRDGVEVSRLTVPAGPGGQTATIDGARLELYPGERSLRAKLEASVRASTQTNYELLLPEGSEVDQLSINGKSEPIRQLGSGLQLLLAPGSSTLQVGSQSPGGLSALFHTPRVQLGSELINAELSVQLPDDRWLLAAGGPGWGPLPGALTDGRRHRRHAHRQVRPAQPPGPPRARPPGRPRPPGAGGVRHAKAE